MNTLSVTMRRRLGAMAGFTLVFILVFLVLLVNAARPGQATSRVVWLWIAALLGAAVAMLVTGRKAYEPLHQTQSHWEYWSETLWACVCTVVTGMSVLALMVFLSTTRLISLNDETGASAYPNRQAIPATGEEPAKVAKTEVDNTKPPVADRKSTDSAPTSGKSVDTVKSDLEESLKKEINDKFAFWGTLFAWLLAIVALVIAVVIWSLQRSAQDLKERSDSLDETLRDFKISLDKHTLAARLQDHLLDLENRLESVRDNNPVFQRLRPIQGLMLAARQVESNDFKVQDFAQRIDRVESAFETLPADRTLLSPRTLAAALRTLAEYLHVVGPRPWLPDDWRSQMQRLFALANRLEALS